MMEQGQRQLGLDFTWDNGQLTWINNLPRENKPKMAYSRDAFTRDE